MAVTIKQMAKELGLSPASISLALRGKPRMSPETIRRVQELAKKLDYVQSNIGRALQSRQSRLIGYLLPGVTRTFYNEILQGAGEETAAHGYGLLVGWVNPGDEHVEHQVNLMLEKDIDGLIISESNHLLDPYLPRFTRRNKPVIFCSSIAPKKYIEVITDNFYGGFLAVETLAEFGHRHVLGCTELPDRFKGNRAAARQYGLRLSRYHRIEDAVAILMKHRDITAVAAYSDHQALDIIYQLRQSGRRIPEDISVIGFNDGPMAARPEFQLTTIAQQRLELGRTAVRCLIGMIHTPDHHPVSQYLKPKLILRNTVQKRS